MAEVVVAMSRLFAALPKINNFHLRDTIGRNSLHLLTLNKLGVKYNGGGIQESSKLRVCSVHSILTMAMVAAQPVMTQKNTATDLLHRFSTATIRNHEESRNDTEEETNEDPMKLREEWIQRRLGLSNKETDRLVKKWSRITTYRIVENLEPKLDWIESRLTLDKEDNSDDLRKLILKYPQIMGLSVKENLDPKLKWLSERLSLDEKELRKMVISLPSIFAYNIDNNLEPKVKYVQRRLSLTDEEVSKMLQRLPQLFCYNESTNLEPKLTWLQERFHLSDKDLIQLVCKHPTILSYSIESNVEPTTVFLEESIGIIQARNLLIDMPRVLGASLNKRLKPRLKEAKEIRGVVVDVNLINRIAKYTTEQWSNHMTKYKNMI